ncbi:acid phosphatase/phosphotransferase [Klebsiella pneumoniae]|uniref:Acid phosphatase/phosphotransferase n=1 Tax=Klebsiella pneumoniae TaxID=573 RepID=A0A2X3CU15_KLEPN|nr:acid phosphatase/phosphotransferase [Klebsiella pneumoniae]
MIDRFRDKYAQTYSRPCGGFSPVHAEQRRCGARLHAAAAVGRTNVAQLAEQAPIHWVSVAQIENSLLGRPPMAVGFDIDDTVLFSSPGFWRGQKTFSPGSEDYLKNPQFWEKMNNGWDEFSMPKEVRAS